MKAPKSLADDLTPDCQGGGGSSMIRLARTASLLLAFCLLTSAGCASAPQFARASGPSPQQFDRDNFECKTTAYKMTRGARQASILKPGLRGNLAPRARENSIYGDC